MSPAPSSGFSNQHLNVVAAAASGTVLEEMIFTAYIGGLPEDVVLTAVRLNGEEYMLPFENTSAHTITGATYANNTQGYTLKVPFDHPVVVTKVNHHPSHASGPCAAN